MMQLPVSWIEVDIIDVLTPNENGKPFQQGWSPQCENYPAQPNEWGVLKTTSIQHGEFWPHENKALPAELEPRPHIEVKPGDILMTCAGPRNRCGVACLVEKTPNRLLMSGKMYRFRPNTMVLDPKFLSYLIQRRQTQLEIDRMKTGINDSGLNLTHDRFAQLRVPVAPLKEQNRIVAKIEELFSELDAATESLNRARGQLKTYRQALLKSAFDGKLTAEWRKHNQEAKRDDLPQIDSILEENLFYIPDSWQCVPLEAITDPNRPVTYGVIKLGADVSDGVPILRSSDVRKLYLDLDGIKIISRKIANEYQRTFLQGGEVLITVRGTLGGVAVVPPELSGWNISREVAMIVPNKHIDGRYLQYALASPQLSSWFMKRLRGVAYTGINIATLKKTPIYICSSAEQNEIVQQLELRLSSISAADNEIFITRRKIIALRQSILKKAFSGQLVPQDPADEPASVLLARLREEVPAPKTRRKKHA